MEKIDFINYRALSWEIRSLKERLQAMETSIYGPKGQRFTSTPRASTGNGKTMEDVVCKHMELEALYRSKLAEGADQLLRIEQAIATLTSPAERMVMQRRYVDGHSWQSICAEMAPLGYSERSVYRLHGEALLKLKEV